MSAIPSLHFPNIDPSNLDDKMDVASSPYRQEDIDIDLESVHDDSILEDDMIDYHPDTLEDVNEVNKTSGDDTFFDDDMLDETVPVEPEPTDYAMEAFVDPLPIEQDEDEDILYEDEEETTTTSHQIEQSTEVVANGRDSAAVAELDNQDDVDDLIDLADEQGVQLDTNDIETDPAHYPPPASPKTHDSRTTPDPIELPAASTSEYQALPENMDQLEPSTDYPYDLDHKHESGGNHNHSIEQVHDVEDDGNEDPPQLQAHELAEEETQTEVKHDDSQQQLHAVTLAYLDEEMSLFPPTLLDDSSVYFLSDTSLAFEPLDKLLAACREVLTGTLDHHDELVLDIPGLGLHISEDSKYATGITLAQILDTYLHLCHNGTMQPIHPLYCHLSSRVSLATQYEYLISCGAQGKSYAEVAADHAETPLDESEGEQTELGDPGAPLSEDDITVAADDADPREEDEVDFDSTNAEHILQATDDDDIAPSEKLVAHASNEEAVDEQEIEITRVSGEPPRNIAETHPTDSIAVQDSVDDHDDVNDEHHLGTGQEPEPDYLEYQDNYEADLDGGAEDLFDHAQPDTADGQNNDGTSLPTTIGDETYAEEELFAGDQVETNVLETTSNSGHEDFPEITGTGTGTLSPHSERTPPPQGQESTSTAAAETHSSPASIPPITPSKNQASKRKIEQDDELDLIDISTPEPKRRRPS